MRIAGQKRLRKDYQSRTILPGFFNRSTGLGQRGVNIEITRPVKVDRTGLHSGNLVFRIIPNHGTPPWFMIYFLDLLRLAAA